MDTNPDNAVAESGYGADYGKRLRTRVVWANGIGLGAVILAVLALVFYAPENNDAVNTAIGLLSTIAGMLTKNSSTIIDYLFGGSSEDRGN